MSKRGRGSIVIKLPGVLVVVILAYVAVMAVSIFDLKQDAETISKSYGQLEGCLDEADYEQAITHLHDLADRVDVMEKKLNDWQWQAASNLPVISDDARCLRGAASIGDSLVNDALMPVVSRAETILGDVSTIGSSLGTSEFENAPSLDAVGGEFSSLAEDVAHARKVVATCQRDAEALPTSHIEELNNLVNKIREVTTQANDVFNTIESIKPIGLLGMVLGGLTQSQ